MPINLKEILASPLNKPREEIPSSALAEAMNGKSAKTEEFLLTESAKPGMSVHIEIRRNDKYGDVSIDADISNQEDLEAFLEKCEQHMPRKRFFGVL